MIKKADIILAVAIVFLSFAFIAVSASGGKGSSVKVTVDGNIYAEYPLETDRTEKIITEYGSNTLLISDGKVSVTDADCPDKYCVSHIKIFDDGQTIVCLPHRLVIEVIE